jgi:hypothetical protein
VRPRLRPRTARPTLRLTGTWTLCRRNRRLGRRGGGFEGLPRWLLRHPISARLSEPRGRPERPPTTLRSRLRCLRRAHPDSPGAGRLYRARCSFHSMQRRPPGRGAGQWRTRHQPPRSKPATGGEVAQRNTGGRHETSVGLCSGSRVSFGRRRRIRRRRAGRGLHGEQQRSRVEPPPLDGEAQAARGPEGHEESPSPRQEGREKASPRRQAGLPSSRMRRLASGMTATAIPDASSGSDRAACARADPCRKRSAGRIGYRPFARA